jgi:carbonic anhydrase
MKTYRLILLLVLTQIPGVLAPRPAGAAEEPHPAPAPAHAPAAHASGEVVEPAAAQQRLVEGNQRFVDEKPRHPHETQGWRAALEKAQKPFAVILGCSDSRVPPELVFDQGFGDLFVIRVAGNVLDEDGIGSIEYAADHLDVRLVVVLGHSKCGAVSAALDHLADPAEEPSEIVSLLYRIEPALTGVPKDAGRDDQVAQAVKQNVEAMVRRLSRVPDLRKALKAGRLRIVGAIYDIHTGKVRFLP